MFTWDKKTVRKWSSEHACYQVLHMFIKHFPSLHILIHRWAILNSYSKSQHQYYCNSSSKLVFELIALSRTLQNFRTFFTLFELICKAARLVFVPKCITRSLECVSGENIKGVICPRQWLAFFLFPPLTKGSSRALELCFIGACSMQFFYKWNLKFLEL